MVALAVPARAGGMERLGDGSTPGAGGGGRGAPPPPTLEKILKFTVNFQVKISYLEAMLFCLLADLKAFF